MLGMTSLILEPQESVRDSVVSAQKLTEEECVLNWIEFIYLFYTNVREGKGKKLL